MVVGCCTYQGHFSAVLFQPAAAVRRVQVRQLRLHRRRGCHDYVAGECCALHVGITCLQRCWLLALHGGNTSNVSNGIPFVTFPPPPPSPSCVFWSSCWSPLLSSPTPCATFGMACGRLACARSGARLLCPWPVMSSAPSTRSDLRVRVPAGLLLRRQSPVEKPCVVAPVLTLRRYVCVSTCPWLAFHGACFHGAHQSR